MKIYYAISEKEVAFFDGKLLMYSCFVCDLGGVQKTFV